MNIYQAIISGVVQGITEFFPISSSGHLVILHSIFGFKKPEIAFDVFLHIGTLLSVLIFFSKDIAAIITKDRRTLYLLAWASVPTFIIGFALKGPAESFFSSPVFVGYMLVINGIWLFLASYFASKKREASSVTPSNSFLIGIAQGLAVIPGISRSGATIATGMLSGIDGEFAVKFSFLLSIPAILGASALKLANIGQDMAAGSAPQFIAGAISAMIVGILAIKALLKLVKNNRLKFFAGYCVLAGMMIILLLK